MCKYYFEKGREDGLTHSTANPKFTVKNTTEAPNGYILCCVYHN